VAIAVVLIAGAALLAAGCALSYQLASNGRASGDAHHDAVSDSPPQTDIEQAVARLRSASDGFADAMYACDSVPSRLTWLAEKARDVANALRECQALGLPAGPTAWIDASWQPPYELRRDGPRDPIAEWQAVDRALEALAATYDEPTSDHDARARVFEQLADATARVADAIGHSPPVSDLALCTFCGKRAREVRRVISGPGVLICDECVVLCVEILEEEIGEDWREVGSDE
jgi:hypothetical protein